MSSTTSLRVNVEPDLPSIQEPKPTSYVVLLSGTHIIGKETLAVSLADSLRCPWIKAEMVHALSGIGSRSQSNKGYNYNQVFGRIWLSKLRRLGFLPEGNGLGAKSGMQDPWRLRDNCMALITCYAMRKPARDAIRYVMLEQSIKPIFVIMNITEETLSGRTLGAEDPELAKRIMGEKIQDIEVPLEDEKDTILIDSMQDVDSLFSEIKDKIRLQLTDL